jgi:hypothetical protein
MNNQSIEPQNMLQATEAFPREDRSLPAAEVIEAQQLEKIEPNPPALFVP